MGKGDKNSKPRGKGTKTGDLEKGTPKKPEDTSIAQGSRFVVKEPGTSTDKTGDPKASKDAALARDRLYQAEQAARAASTTPRPPAASIEIATQPPPAAVPLSSTAQTKGRPTSKPDKLTGTDAQAKEELQRNIAHGAAPTAEAHVSREKAKQPLPKVTTNGAVPKKSTMIEKLKAKLKKKNEE